MSTLGNFMSNAPIGTVETNRVLRNTFGLVGLSLIPTAFGAYAGIAMGLPAIMAASPILSTVIFIVLAFALLYGIRATQNSAASLPLVGVFTLFMGAMLSGIISVALGRESGAEMIAVAALGTAAITWGCSIYAMRTTRDFSKLGGMLFGGLLAIIVVGVLNIWLQLTVLALILSIVTIVLFSAYMVFDVQNIVKGGETNYVTAAVHVYLNAINIFSSLLQLLLIFNNDD